MTPPSRPKRVRYRCPKCFAEMVCMPHPEGEGPSCGCKMPKRWTTMERVPPVKRTRKTARERRIATMAASLANPDGSGLGAFVGSATRPVGQ